MAERQIQLAKNYKELKGKAKEKVFEHGGFISTKMDGVWVGVLIEEGEVKFYSSSLEPMISMQDTPAHDEFKTLPPGFYIGELYSDTLPQKDISGISRKKVAGHGRALKVGLHDLVTTDEARLGKSGLPFEDRLHNLNTAVYPVDTFHTYKYLWVLPQLFVPPAIAEAQFVSESQAIARVGGEGGIFKPRYADWEQGERGFNVIRIKATLTYDLQVIGVSEVERTEKGGLTGVIHVRWRMFGQPDGPATSQPIRGMTHKELEAWAENPSLIESKIVEVEAMNITPLGMLREPRFKSVRHDKPEADL